jgi:translation elongation factor EF-1alpha
VGSDWIAVERERGISVSSAVMSFEHEGLAFNLLDTPGQQDFSGDTYRFHQSADQHAVAAIAWYFAHIGAHDRAGGSLRRELAIPDLNLIK